MLKCSRDYGKKDGPVRDAGAHERPRPMNASAASVRHVQLGQCQLCEAEFKLHGGCLVLHGYTRPGDGQIFGRCQGIGHLPYQQSCDLLVSTVAIFQKDLVGARARLAAFDAGKVTACRFLTKDRNGSVKTVYASAGGSTPDAWRRALDIAHGQAKSEVFSLEQSIARFTARIAAWKLSPVKETTEEAIAATEQAEKDARKAAKLDAKKAKEAKRAELDAKAEKRKEALRVVLEGFAAQFKALAAQPKSPERTAAAQALAIHVQAPKWEKIGGYWGFMDLGCDPALIELGLAEESPRCPGRAGRYILPAYTKAA